jgi:stress response protein YsnF
MAAMTQTQASSMSEVEEAREQTAARLERLARIIRANTTADVAQLDAVYSEIVKMAGKVRPMLEQ